MAAVSIFTDLTCVILSSSDVHVRPVVGVLVSGLKREVQVAAGWLLRAGVFILSTRNYFAVGRSQTLLEGLGQVTVGVLFPINSLQIFFLDQNVNAFLGIICLKRRGSEREEKQIYYQERQTVSWLLPYLAAQWGGSKVTSDTSHSPPHAVLLPGCQRFAALQGAPQSQRPQLGRVWQKPLGTHCLSTLSGSRGRHLQANN